MKKIYCLAFCCLFSTSLFAQYKIVPKFIRRTIFEKDSSKRSSIIPLPVLSSAPETGLEVGGSLLYSFYTDTLHSNTRVSNIFAYGTITTKGQYRASISTSYWSPGNKYHYTAALSYLNFPFNFYGIGNATNKADAQHIGQKRYKFSVGAEKLVAPHLYLGLNAGAFRYKFSSDTIGIFETDPQVQNREGGSSVTIGPSFIFDTRNNNTYTTHGILLNTSYNYVKGIFANNGYSGGLFAIEFSQYFGLSKHFVLAYDLYNNSLLGSQTPFYLLPAMGSDSRMRGYYNGRYRDKNYAAGQAELRYRINDRFGIVAFGGTGTVWHDQFSTDILKPNYGGGLRYFFDVEKGLSIRLDYGVGEQRPGESRQSGFYIGLGEAF
ncbi:polymerase [Mucilaginibacter sp. AW1-3]